MSVSFGKVYYFSNRQQQQLPTGSWLIAQVPPGLQMENPSGYPEAREYTQMEERLRSLWLLDKWPHLHRGMSNFFFMAWTHMILLSLTILKGETGKLVVFGFDIKGRPIFYMIPSRQNKRALDKCSTPSGSLNGVSTWCLPGPITFSHLPSPMLRLIKWHESETLPSWLTMTIKTRIHPWAWHALSSTPSKTITRSVWVSASWFTSHSLSTSSWKFSRLLWIL